MSATSSSIPNVQSSEVATPAPILPDVSPQPAILPPAGSERVSSVDRLPESPGYEPVTMADLWKIADRAIDVVSAARRHLPTGDPGKDPLFKVGDELLAVEFYTCNLRECAR